MNVTEDLLYFNCPTMSKQEAIQFAGEKLVEHNFVEPAYISSMLKKEETNCTYIGNGIAIPHGLYEAMQYVKDSGIVMLHFREGIQYDQNIVYLVIGIAANEGSHMGILADIATKLSQNVFVQELVKQKDKQAFLTFFHGYQSS